MKEEGPGNMLGLNPGMREPPFPMLPGFRGIPGMPPTNNGGPMPLPHPPANGSNGPPLPNMWPFIWNHISNLLPQLSIARMDPLSQVFSLRWNQHQSNMLSVFDKLLQSEAFCDVTLACDGGSLKCHKIVLAASSDYFQKLFMENNSEHPIVFLKDVKAVQVRAILDYMYKGEVSVAQEELPSLLRVAELLKVKGMIEDHNQEKGLDCKNSHPRTSSPGSAPPNSVAPPLSTSNGEPVPSSGSLSAPPPRTPTSGGIHPPHGAIPPNFRPFLTPPGQNSTPPFPMWPLPGLFQGAHNLFNRHDERKDLSPGPRERHKLSSGSSSDKEVPLPPLIPREGNEIEKPGYEGQTKDPEHGFHDPRNPYHNEKSPKSMGYGGQHGMDKLEGIAGYVPTQRLEWKRYKQYTRNDIMAAIEEVKKGKSALQVSKKFNIPSRTLYDKVKKMGISTGRQQQRKSMNSNFNGMSTAYSAAFPGLNMMSPLSHLPEGLPMDNPYKNLMDRMKEVRDDEDSRDTRDSEGDKEHRKELGPIPPEMRKDLGPMPFSILPPHMLNMMERIKAEGGEREHRDREEQRESSPMNLSSERDDPKRMSEGSFPHSPSPSSGEMTSPSNCQNSPTGPHSDYQTQGQQDRYSDRDSDRPSSPDRQQIDIRAQFLADLRRLGDRRPQSPEMDLNRSHDYGGIQENLPPRKRKVSQEVDNEPSSKLNLQEHKVVGGLNGIHEEGRDNSTVVN